MDFEDLAVSVQEWGAPFAILTPGPRFRLDPSGRCTAGLASIQRIHVFIYFNLPA